MPFGSLPAPKPKPAAATDTILARTPAYEVVTQPRGTWLLITVGTAFSEDPQANRFTLDQVAPHHPVKLELWTGHGMYFNTLGLQALEIAEDAADPFGGFYERAQQLMYNPTVANAFSFSEEESARYGSSGFGNACAIAKKIVAADQGTRFIQISLGGWDHHEDIYDSQAARSIFDPRIKSVASRKVFGTSRSALPT